MGKFKNLGSQRPHQGSEGEPWVWVQRVGFSSHAFLALSRSFLSSAEGR